GQALGTARFTRGQADVLAWYVVVISPILAIGFLAMLLWPGARVEGRAVAWGGAVLFLVSGPLLLRRLFPQRRWPLTVHGQGVFVLNAGGPIEFRFEEVEQFGFAVTRLTVEDEDTNLSADLGRRYELTFALNDDRRRQVVTWKVVSDRRQDLL